MPYIKQREMTAAQWTTLNPVLLKGEIGWESGATTKAKKGDGSTAWNSLPYWFDATVLLGRAPLASPAFTGNPTAPTAITTDNDTSIATTAFVQAVAALRAPLASPTFTGDPKAPTATAGDNDTSIATTAFVQAAITALIAGSPALLNTLKELADAIGDDPNFAATMTTALGLKAPLANPTFTGDPKAPTATVGDSDTSIATTAFVQAAIGALTKSGVYTPSPDLGTGILYTSPSIPHGLSGTPKVLVSVGPHTNSSPIIAPPILRSVDATNFVFMAQKVDNTAFTSNARSFTWMATLL